MPRPYQIIPKNSYPTEETYVNDNTVVTNSLVDVAANTVSFLYVVNSPKGKDGVVQTIEGQQDFVNKIGIGPYSLYGQSLISAYAVASTGNAIVHVLRVAAPDATYANITVCAKFMHLLGEGLAVKFVAHSSKLTDLDELESAYTPSDSPDDEGFTEVKLFSVAALGRGKYGNNYQVRLSSIRTADKENNFKNYQFEIYESDVVIDQKESFHVCFSENALIGDTSYYADAVIGDPVSGSEYVKFVSYPEGFERITAAYNDAVNLMNNSIVTDGNGNQTNPNQGNYLNFTVDDIDIFGGTNKYNNKALDWYTIDTTADDCINPYGADGYPDIILADGSDGALDASKPITEREKVLDDLYKKAFSGEIDPMIKSKNKFPTSIIPDCGYSFEIKNLIKALNDARGDSIALFDMGTQIKTHQSVLDTGKANFLNYVSTYESVDGYCGKIRDPYSKKIITVTSTYALCLLYAKHFATFNGKHIPLADNDYGNLEDVFLSNTIYPVFDEDIHSDMMNELIDARINFARYNANQETKRSTQTTRQEQLSMLSELHNCFILKDVKRAMERLCATNRFDFADSMDIIRFNNAAENVASKFRGQVVSIEAKYGQTEYEKERSIIHLYVTIVNRSIVKTTIIEIDVNRE